MAVNIFSFIFTYSLALCTRPIYSFSLMTAIDNNAQDLANRFLRSLKIHDFNNGEHASLETFASFVDVDYKITKTLLIKTSRWIRTVRSSRRAEERSAMIDFGITLSN